MSDHTFDRFSEAQLRARNGEKWRTFDKDIIPATVGEMDFEVAEPIRRAIIEAAKCSDLGYPLDPQNWSLPEITSDRMRERFSWHVRPERVTFLSDVMQGVYIAIHQLTKVNDGIVVLVPTYPPLLEAPRLLGRRLLPVPLCVERDGCAIDFDAVKAQAGAGATMILLCNPQNPTGHVLSQRELLEIADLAIRYNLLIVSDEIYQDLVYATRRHIPVASMSAEIQRRTITLVSATKAFGIAGIGCAVAIFGDADVQVQFDKYPRRLRGRVTTIALAALRAAWTEGNEWLREVVPYLQSNRDEMSAFISAQMPSIRLVSPEGTFFAWLDLRDLHLSPGPVDYLLHHAKVALSDGDSFGAPVPGFVRFNFATPKPILREALNRFARALTARRNDVR